MQGHPSIRDHTQKAHPSDIFNPTRGQAREFFTETWRKQQEGLPLTPLESMAADLIGLHPEYHADLADPQAATRDYPVEGGRTNPFLHLSMHLAIAEQVSVDQPPGIRAAWGRLMRRRDAHEAAHIVMEALGVVIWEAGRMGIPPDNDRYLDLIRRHTTRNR